MIERGSTPLGKMLQKHEWSEYSIARALYVHAFRNKHTVIVPNSYFTGFEADLLVVRNDLRLMDVEIKISRSDLKADQYKDKWLHPGPHSWGWGKSPPRDQWPRLEWPRKIWKHYYCMPREIWSEDLLAYINPKSGILLMKTVKHQGYKDWLTITVKRQASPKKEAKPISPEEVMDIARGCSDRMWRAMGCQTAGELESASLSANNQISGSLG